MCTLIKCTAGVRNYLTLEKMSIDGALPRIAWQRAVVV